MPTGVQFAYVNADSNNSPDYSSDTLTSDVLGTVAGGETYTLTVAVGNRADAPLSDNGTYTISLLDGGTVLASQSYAGSSITPGTWYEPEPCLYNFRQCGYRQSPGSTGLRHCRLHVRQYVRSGRFYQCTANGGAQNTPAAPSGLTATAASTSEIDLNWTNNDAILNDETGFQIDQATNSDFSTGLTTVTVGANVITYRSTGLASGTTYYYRVRATNDVGDSANTPTASALTAALGTPVAVAVPDGNFTDTPGNYINATASGGGGTFTSPMNATLSGWAITATPSTANGGYYALGGWDPYGVVDSVTSSGASPSTNNAPWLGNQPASTYNAFIYYPGEAV